MCAPSYFIASDVIQTQDNDRTCVRERRIARRDANSTHVKIPTPTSVHVFSRVSREITCSKFAVETGSTRDKVSASCVAAAAVAF